MANKLYSALNRRFGAFLMVRLAINLEEIFFLEPK